MSKFTTEVRFICETAAGYDESQGYDKVEEIIETAAPKIFGNFPIYDENYRLPLEIKILRHFYTREICEETVGLWKLRLMDRMNVIMPFYNKLYNSELLKFNPFYDVDLTRDYKRADAGSTADTSKENVVGNEKKNLGEISVSDGLEKGKEGNRGSETHTSSEIQSAIGNEKAKGTGVNQYNEATGSKEKRTGNVSGSESNEYQETDSDSRETNSWDLYNDTPQGGIQGLAGVTNPNQSPFNGGVGTGTGYLTNARHDFDNETGASSRAGGNVRKNNAQDNSVSENDATRIGGSEEINDSERNTNSVVDRSGEKVVARDGGRDVEKRNTKQDNRNVIEQNENDVETKRVGESIITNLSDYIEHVVGKQGTASYSKMLMEFRETFLNIDNMILKELEPLFFGLWE